jgi:integrase
MIELQRLKGMRPGELVIMRPCDIDRGKSIWLYRPMSHKTAHQGIRREVFIGPRAQQILQPFLLRDAESFLFSPREAMLEHKQQRRLSAKDVKIRAAADVKLRVSERIGERYTRNGYHNAVHKACRKAGISPWGPNRLRHNAATLLREQFGIEAARVILGHTIAGAPRSTRRWVEKGRLTSCGRSVRLQLLYR